MNKLKKIWDVIVGDKEGNIEIDPEKYLDMKLTPRGKKHWKNLLEKTRARMVKEDDPILSHSERTAKCVLWENEGWDMYLTEEQIEIRIDEEYTRGRLGEERRRKIRSKR